MVHFYVVVQHWRNCKYVDYLIALFAHITNVGQVMHETSHFNGHCQLIKFKILLTL
jgi:hypothetical protein